MIIVGGVFVLGGLFFLVIGVNAQLRYIKKRKECTKTIIARVMRTDTKVSYDSDRGSSVTLYAPVFEYYVNEKLYIKVHNVYTSYHSYKYECGQSVEINYNPNDPYIFYVTNEKSSSFINMVTMAMGVMFMLLGLLVMIGGAW